MTAVRRVLAVPVFGEAAGGTGEVGRLLWDVFQREWPGHAWLTSLQEHGGAPPSVAQKVAFGGRLALGQILSRVHSIFFGHLGLVGVERFVPPARRAPYGVFLHGIEVWKPLTAVERRGLRDARLRVANSHFTARRTAEANPDVGPVAVCPLALPQRQRAGAPRATDVSHRKPTVLIVGRMAAEENYKGHDELIDAWPHVRASIPDAELVVAGEGDDAARLRTKAGLTTGGRGITFTGFVDRAALDDLYREAAIFAMPSRGEGFGLVYLEAMAHELPCIGSVHDAAGEVIEHGTTGLLVDLNDREALGRAIVCLLRDPALRLRMGEAGSERQQQHFTFDRFSRDVVSLLADGMNDRSA